MSERNKLALEVQASAILEKSIQNNNPSIWNNWRAENKGNIIDLRSANIAGGNLSRYELTKVDLSGVSLKGCVLKSVTLTNSLLNNADFSDCVIKKSTFFKSTFLNSNFTDATIDESTFFNASFQGAKFYQTMIRKSGFCGTNFSDSKLNSIKADRTDFSNCDFSEASMRFAHLINVNLNHSNLWKTDLSDAEITGVSLYNAARADWIISRVKCDYLYVDEKRDRRVPSTRKFKKGEFERKFKKLPSFDIEVNKISDLQFLTKIADLYNQQTNCDLALKSIDIPCETAVFTVLRKEDLVKTENEIRLLKDRHMLLEGRYSNEKEHNKLLLEMVTNMGNVNITNNVHGNISGQINGDYGKLNISNNYSVSHDKIKKIEEEINGHSDIADGVKEDLLNTLRETFFSKGKEVTKECLSEFMDKVKNYIAPYILPSMLHLNDLLTQLS